MTDIRSVFDTNVLVSSLLVANGQPFKALERALGSGRLVFTPPTFAELVAVLSRRKFDRYLPLSRRMDFAMSLEQGAVLVSPVERIVACRDPKDEKFLEAAVSGGAQTLVTGDNDLLTLNPFRGISIITPQAFLNAPPR